MKKVILSFALSFFLFSLVGCGTLEGKKGDSDQQGQDASLPSKFTEKYKVEFFIYKTAEEGQKPTEYWKVFELNDVEYLSKIDKPTEEQIVIPPEVYVEGYFQSVWYVFDKDNSVEGCWMFSTFLVTDNLQLFSSYGV